MNRISKFFSGLGSLLTAAVFGLFKALAILLKHMAIAVWYLIKWGSILIFNCLYLLSRLISLPFRLCFPIDNIDKMDGVDFENFAAKWLKYNGYRDIRTTPVTADYGVDLLARRDGVLYGIQCKRYSGNVGISAVQQISAGIAYYECDKGIVFTNSELTRSAQNLSEANGIEVIDGELLRSTKAADLIVRSRSSLVLSSILMSILLAASIALCIWCLIQYPSFALLAALLILLCVISLVNARHEIRKRDQNPENFDPELADELKPIEHEPF